MLVNLTHRRYLAVNHIKMLKTEIGEKRSKLILYAQELLGVPYRLGASWENIEERPEALDCSELVTGVYKKTGLNIPDGAQAQFNFTRPCLTLEPGDIAFFGSDKNPKEIYHVGLVVSREYILEARASDKTVSFETGQVILRPIYKWEQYKNFCGFRCHPALYV